MTYHADRTLRRLANWTADVADHLQQGEMAEALLAADLAIADAERTRRALMVDALDAGWTMAQVGDALGITKQAVSQAIKAYRESNGY